MQLRHAVALGLGWGLALGLVSSLAAPPTEDDLQAFVRVSPRDPRYFELSNGRAYVPIGFNLVGGPAPEEFERIVQRMADSGVNYCRIWLDGPPWNVEHARSGEYDVAKAKHLDRFLELCAARGIRVKMCVEYFRTILAANPPPPARGQFPKLMHHVANGGGYQDMVDYLTSAKGQDQFRGKLRWYADRYGSRPTIFAWELWNEMNAVRGDWRPWTRLMLPELKRLFPSNLAVQSLGSFDTDRVREAYRELCQMPDNDVLQVHRYLDPGARLEVCKGPVDAMAADAVRALKAFGIRKPIILTETGAVQANHAGVSELYRRDRAGLLLHDMLYAPFFAGAAGPGHVWWWREAIDRPNLWEQFARFQQAIAGLDIPAEAFETRSVEQGDWRLDALIGKHTTLLWIRDRRTTWTTELVEGVPPARHDKPAFDLGFLGAGLPKQARVYDPWTNQTTNVPCAGGRVVVPEVTRSCVVRLVKPAP